MKQEEKLSCIILYVTDEKQHRSGKNIRRKKHAAFTANEKHLHTAR